MSPTPDAIREIQEKASVLKQTGSRTLQVDVPESEIAVFEEAILRLGKRGNANYEVVDLIKIAIRKEAAELKRRNEKLRELGEGDSEEITLDL